MNNERYLVHHGILGQKWGVRRYQNEDGSLTAAGKARYDTGIISSRDGDRKTKKKTVARKQIEQQIQNSQQAQRALDEIRLIGEQQVQQMFQQQNQMQMQTQMMQQQEIDRQLTQQAIQDSMRIQSMGVSYGMNPFMFG